jgi:glycosyltransferase involved in cell wall biosynthesis
MTVLYLTADQVGTETGGGLVTYEESMALTEFAGPLETEVWERNRLHGGHDPWGWDLVAYDGVDHWSLSGVGKGPFPTLCHIYSGSFSKTVASLKRNGCKVCYTIAAHDRKVSREEHEKLGIPFPYTHLTEEPLWKRYIEGYRLADVIVCPGSVPAKTVRDYGPEFKDKKIVIIPHGCHLPEKIAPLPKRFTVGYLGSYGPDKGVRYLLEAWKKLAYKDATLLLGGKDSTSPFVLEMIRVFGGGNIVRVGWVKNVSDFYNACSLYVQPSATEGFGIEVVETMAHARPVLCSDGAGACDLLPAMGVFRARDADALAIDINKMRKVIQDKVYFDWDILGRFEYGTICRYIAERHTWSLIRERYKELWREILYGS